MTTVRFASMVSVSLCASLLLFAGVGCGPELGPEDNPKELVDSTGVVFPWDCGDEGCRIGWPADKTAMPEPRCLPGDEWGIGLMWGRFHLICGVCSSKGSSAWSTTDGACRPTACKEDRDCPQLYIYRPQYRFVCRAGLCQASDRHQQRVDHHDVRTLCFAAIPRDKTVNVLGEASLEAMRAAEKTCPQEWAECDVPASCWQP